ncbi:MAG TPA: peptide chain release factor N(5)-glutamine methyltransferase [Thermodesulfovibrionales bacterium]|nr:peptide chain release factor N(5)-glutamine methyltransferase [Thermodesulfovibrionales bacterium]
MIRASEGMREVSKALSTYGIEDSWKEAEIILTQCIGLERVVLYRDDPLLSALQVETLRKVLERRGRSEPIQYIIGHVNFFGLTINVGPGVLIPRPETELLVEGVINTFRSHQFRVISQRRPGHFSTERRLKILDLCTGSGCLALALAKEFPRADVVGTDISETALGYARGNAQMNGIENVTFLKGTLFEPLQGMRFDIVVSNPPYIRRGEIGSLQREIYAWEPLEALDGGEDGLEFYREILLGSMGYLEEGGFMVMEIGDGESGDVAAMAKNLGFKNISIHKDYSAMERVLRIVL